MRYCFVQDDDCHWYLIPWKYVDDIRKYWEAMENGRRYAGMIDYEACMVSDISSYSFEDPFFIEGK